MKAERKKPSTACSTLSMPRLGAQTAAVQWTFPRGHAHLWDRTRNLSRVRWDDIEVLQHLDRRQGLAWENGSQVTGPRQRELVAQAWAHFANDSFWLAAPFKARDEGTTRSWATVDGVSGALVQYGTGGVTPGDAYLWILGEDGRPTHWRMWVSIIPVGGVRVTWEGWTQLSTGAWVATSHEFDPIPLRLELEDVAAAASVRELVGDDPFIPLLNNSNHARENGTTSGS